MKERWTKTRMMLCALAMCIAVCLPATGLAGEPYVTAVVNNPNPADRLNLRVAPSVNAASLGRYYNGTSVTLLDNEADGWVQVYIGGEKGGAQGYMQTRYLALGDARAKVKPAFPLYESTSSRWELYNFPRRDQNACRIFGVERAVEVLGVTDTWWHVRIREHTGYVQANASFLKATALSGGLAIGYAAVNNPNPADRLHLRTSPRTSAMSLGKYYNGVQVDVLEYLAGGWVKVRIGDTVGYMLGRYLAFGDERLNVRSAIPVMRVNNPNPNDRLNLRKAASDKAESLGKYSNGTTVEVLGIGTTWHHVRAGEHDIGYMMAKYLR